MSNYTWYLQSDLTEFEGKWVAIAGEKVVASAMDLKLLTSEVSKKFSLESVSFVKVPDKKEALVYKCSFSIFVKNL